MYGGGGYYGPTGLTLVEDPFMTREFSLMVCPNEHPNTQNVSSPNLLPFLVHTFKKSQDCA